MRRGRRDKRLRMVGVARRRLRLAALALAAVLGVLAIAIAAIALALVIAPRQTVAAPHQPIEVGAVPPTLTLSGPAQLSIDSRRVDTAIDLPGPLRPLIQVSRNTINGLVARAEATRSGSGLSTLGSDVEGAWVRYVIVQAVIVAGAAVLITGAVIGWEMILRSREGRGRGRRFWRKRAAAFVVCLFVAVGLDAAGLPQMPSTLARVRSLTDLFGTTPVPHIAPAGPERTDVQAVVIGDSTAAGEGNPLVSNPTPDDVACQRSRDAYPAALAAATGWNVLNLGCSGATISEGLIGTQHIGDHDILPQLAVLEQVRSVKYVFVSIGANDLEMGAMVGVCVAVHECSDPAQAALFQAELDAFTQAYSQLLAALAALPGKPQVVINLYYDGLGNGTCVRKLLGADSIAFLRSWFDDLNTTLATGAQLFGFTSTQPNFAGHQYCDPHPYIQNLSAKAPLHPNIAGQLSIALADLRAVRQPLTGVGQTRSTSAP